jgi:hypothetical protein
MVLASLPELAGYGSLARAMWGRSELERGRLAADEGRSLLARAGRVRLRRRLAATAGRPLAPSGVAAGWAWVVTAGHALPSDAKVYLNVPLDLLYYYGTYFWYPARVAVSLGPVEADDGDSLRASARPVPSEDFGELAARGFTHVVAEQGGSLALVALAPRPEAPRP